MRLNKNGSVDRRFKNLEARETLFWQRYGNYIAVAILGALVGASAMVWFVNSTRTSPKPVGINTMIVEAKEPTPAKDYVSRFFDIIRTNESSYGTNKNPVALHNYCKNKGQWNEIGYNPHNKFCFGDIEEAKLFVTYYIKRYCENKSLSSCLCFWNTGKKVETCHYSDGNLSKAN